MKTKFPCQHLCLGILLGTTTAINGCFVTTEHTGAKPSAIHVGTSSKTTIFEKLGYPDMRTFDGRFFLYVYSRNTEVWSWGGDVTNTWFDIHTDGRVLIQFDDNGVVERRVVHKCEKKKADLKCAGSEASLWAMIEDLLGQDRVDKYRQRHGLATSLARPLQEAVSRGDAGEIKRLILQGASVHKESRGRMPLHIAARQGQTAVAKLLIANGAYVDEAAAIGLRTPLYEAAKNGHISLAQLLLTEGANVNATGAKGTTPLHVVAFREHVDVVKLLLSNGADVNAKSDSGESPLHMAAENGNVEITQLLLAHGAKVNVHSKPTGDTPLHVAAGHGHTTVAELLLANGAKVNSRRRTWGGAHRPLHSAVRSCHTVMVELLIEKGAKASSGTPLYYAVKCRDTALVELLLAHGANVKRGTSWSSPIHSAVANGDYEMTRLLLENGAKVNAKKRINEDRTFLGWRRVSPMERAMQMGRGDLVELLRKHGGKE